jgi:hypothetical protein
MLTPGMMAAEMARLKQRLDVAYAKIERLENIILGTQAKAKAPAPALKPPPAAPPAVAETSPPLVGIDNL